MAFDKWFYINDSGYESYIAVDSSTLMYFRGDQRYGYGYAYGFYVKRYPQESLVYCPVVYEDFTLSDGMALVPVELSEVPDAIIKRLKRTVKSLHREE